LSYCRKCGAKLEPEMAYCPKCGTPVAIQQPYENRRRNENRPLNPLVIVGIVILAVAAVAIVLVFVGGGLFGHVGSGELSTQNYDFDGFTAVSPGDGFNVEITQGSIYSVKVTTDDNLQQYVDIHKSGSTLEINLQPGSYQTTDLTAQITMPNLQKVQASGGSVVNAQNLNLVTNFGADLSGGSRLTMVGQGVDVTLVGSGGANLYLADFQVNNAQVDLSGGTQCTVNATGTISGVLSGGAHLYYRGNPTLGSIDTTGGSSISQVP
jgi:hypothetical protein